MEYIVSKFGGWANASAQRVKLAADLFEQNPCRRVKVNSAIGKIEGLPKVTDLLIQGAEEALKNGSFPTDIYNLIKRNHSHVFLPLGITQSQIDEVLTLLDQAIATQEEYAADYFNAKIIGLGEELFSRLDEIYMREIRGLNVKYVDPRQAGHYLIGHPLEGKIMDVSYDNLGKLKEIPEIIIYPGFFAVDIKGKPMIYSRGGSDKTAADIARATQATIYENWKDVDGVYSADPNVIEQPLLMKEVTYKEIRELSYISFNVLHQEAMLPVMQARIPICIKNLLKPQSPGTMIVNKRDIDCHNPIIGIAHMENVCFVNIEKSLMNQEIGFAENIFTIFREHKISIDQITTGIDSICLTVMEDEFEEKSVQTGVSRAIRKKVDICEFSLYLRSWLNADTVKIKKNKALICIVGEGMRHHIGILSRITRVLAENKINIEIMDQGPSERTVIIGIDCENDPENARKAVKIIYNEYFTK